MAYFPFMMNVENQTCLIVGGGKIAYHKVQVLLPFQVHIRIIAQELCPQLEALHLDTQIVDEITCTPSLFEGVDFVVVATNNREVNHRVATYCRKHSILVNTVDQKEDCDFFFPAIIKQGDITISISSDGKSPTAVAALKKDIQTQVPDYIDEVVSQMGTYRNQVLDQVEDDTKRKKVFERMYAYALEHKGQLPKEEVDAIMQEQEGRGVWTK